MTRLFEISQRSGFLNKTCFTSLVSLMAFLLSFGSFAQAELTCENIFATEAHQTQVRLAGAQNRWASPIAGPLEMSRGRNLYVEMVAGESAEAPFYLFLPGSNRSLFLNESPLAQSLVMTGAGVGAMNFSTQPHSIASLKPGVQPAFYSTDMKLKDFADEVEFAIASLRSRGYKNIIPISLSYSGAVSPLLKAHDLIIETSPMTSLAAARPDLGEVLEFQKITNFWSPIFGAALNRSVLDKGYRDNWSKQADQMIQQFNLPADRRSDFIEGYLRMSRAAETADWNSFDLAKTSAGLRDQRSPKPAMPSAGSRRVFILGGKESPSLMKDQLKTFLALAKADPRTSLIVIEPAGHVVPADQPQLYSWAVEQAVVTPNGPGPFFFMVQVDKEGKASVHLRKGEDAIASLKQSIEDLP